MEFLKTKITPKKLSYNPKLAGFLILKIVKGIMRDGKYQKFFKFLIWGIQEAALEIQENEGITITPIRLLYQTIRALEPFCNLKAVKASGRKILVPTPFRAQKKITVAVRFFIKGIYSRHDKFEGPIFEAIVDEIRYVRQRKRTNQSEGIFQKQKFISNIFFNEKHLRFLQSM